LRGSPVPLAQHLATQMNLTPFPAISCHFLTPSPAPTVTQGPKYSLPEFERRWQVPGGLPRDIELGHPRVIHDRYIRNTRLRLRKVRDPDGGVVLKLGKKYPSDDGGFERVVSVYLHESEFELLAALPAWEAGKRRYAVVGGALDEYLYPRQGLVVFEVEFDSEQAARDYQPPAFAGAEITGDASFSGFTIARHQDPGQP